jgi:orotate phosphoribosyltransferase
VVEKSNSDADRLDLIRDLGRRLLESNALSFGEFRLSSGRKSSYYIDLRVAPSIPSLFSILVQGLISILEEIGTSSFDAICGIPTSGLTYATAVAHRLNMPLVYVRNDQKLHGTGKTLEGLLKPGDRVLIIDDLITSGSSILAAAEKIRAEEGLVSTCIVLIDRKEGGANLLNGDQIQLHSLSSIGEIAEILYDMKLISDSQRGSLREQIQ